MSIEAHVRRYHNFFLGEDKTLQFAIKDDAEAAVNISGWAMEWTFFIAPGSSALLTKTVGSGITITNGAAGICEVTLADTDTESLTARRYLHELWRTDTGLEAQLAHGQIDLRDH